MRSFKLMFSKLNNQFFGSRPFWTAVLSILLCASIGFSGAFFTTDLTAQKLELSASEISASAGKVITNTSGKSAYVRAYLVPYWESTGTGKEYVGITEWDINEKINNGELVINDTDWIKSGNYYYYKNALAPNGTTTNLVNTFKSDGVYSHTRNKYYNPKISLPNELSNNTGNSAYNYPHLTVFEHNSRLETQVEVDFERDYSMSTVASSFESGTGTEADPYIITNGTQLLKCVTSSGVAENGAQLYYKLGTDIYLNEFKEGHDSQENINGNSLFDKYNQWVYSRDIKSRFCGNFDGNGFTVNGLYLPDPTRTDLYVNNVDNNDGKVISGLFPCLGPGAVIKNLGVVDSDFRNVQCGGIIAGYVAALSPNDDPVTIENCFVQSFILEHSEEDGDYLGGLVGYANLASPTDGSSLLNIKNTYVFGRFDIWGGRGEEHSEPNNSIDNYPQKHRGIVVGGSNNPASISINNGYAYFTTEDNTVDLSAETRWEHKVSFAPSGANVSNFFDVEFMGNLPAANKTNTAVTNYDYLKSQFKDIKYDNGLGNVWAFTDMSDINAELYPENGLLVSLVNSHDSSNTVAHQAYRIAYELLQADGIVDGNSNKSAIVDAWGAEAASLITLTSVDTLNNGFDFYHAYTNAAYNYYGERWFVAGVNENNKEGLQPTLSGQSLKRMQPNTGDADKIQTAAELMSGSAALNKKYTPCMAFYIYAPKAGTYEVVPEFTASFNENNFSLISVNDGDYQRCNFSKIAYGNETFSANIMRVSLKAGVNTVRVILTKEVADAVNATKENWVNFNGLWVSNQDNLEVLPDQFTNMDLYDDSVWMPNAKINKYNDQKNQDCINTGDAHDAHWNLVTHENLNSDNFELVPYSTFEINNSGYAGYYDFELVFDCKASKTGDAAEGYIVVRVNGVNYKRYFKAYNSGGGTEETVLNISVPLNSGVNQITITAPLDINSNEDGWKYGYVSWFNQINITFHRPVTTNAEDNRALDIITESDPDVSVVAPHPSILEAETYGYANRYNQIESAGGVTVVGGINPWYQGLPDWRHLDYLKWVTRSANAGYNGDSPYFLDSNASPHIDYYVYAPKDGYYQVKPRMYFVFKNNCAFSNTNKGDGPNQKNYFTVMVNDKLKRHLYNGSDPQGRFMLTEDSSQRHWYDSEITVPLKKGINVIRIIPIDSYTTTGPSSEGKQYGVDWVNHDYLELMDENLVGVKPNHLFQGALDSKYIFSYDGANPNGTDSNGNVGYNKGEGDYADLASPFGRKQLKWMDATGYSGINAADYSNILDTLTIKDLSNHTWDSVIQTNGKYGLPGISYTINTPVEGYYDLTLAYSTNPRFSEDGYDYSLVAFVNSGTGVNERAIIPFNPLSVIDNGKADVSLYLKKGLNTVTISSPVDSNFINHIVNGATINGKNEKEFFDIGALRISQNATFVPKVSAVDPRS